MSDERRIAKRFAIQLNKITGAEVTRPGSDPVPCYVYVADISEGGLRITTDTWFDIGEKFGLRLQLSPPLESQVEIVWRKLLTGGTNVYGLKFVEVPDALAGQVKAFIESFSPEAHRRDKGENLNRVVCMQFPDVTNDRRIYVLTHSLTTDEMNVTAETPFERGLTYACLLFLEPEAPPVVARAHAVEARKAVFDRCKVQFRFDHLEGDGAARINDFLDKVLSGEIDREPIPPEPGFTSP